MTSETQPSAIKQAVSSEVKVAMRAKDKPRLSVLRTIMAEFKKIEVDERIILDDARVLIVLDRMVKQRKDSANQYIEAGRTELADTEQAEIVVIQDFLPQALTQDEIAAIVSQAVIDTAASSMADMGKVMGLVKPQVQGRADMGDVSKLVKAAFA